MNNESQQGTQRDPLEPYRRRPTRVISVGDLRIGGQNPILIQSMTISDTMDTDSVVREIEGLVSAGCPLVRLTCPSVREAGHLAVIKKNLRQRKIDIPLVADIHFTPNAALRAAELVEKVRINPGNYVDRKKNAVREYSDAEYRIELERIHEHFKPLVLKCIEHGTALRIGTNHGSLSDRIMNRYGDTPMGMVESALEFVRICREYDFHNIVLSLKSSITSVTIEAHRHLIERMRDEKMDYPIHLGITEAGSGPEARIKSAIGIGGLLTEGIGDTIRVSLTEPSVNEIAAGRRILGCVAQIEPEFAAYVPERRNQADGDPPDHSHDSGGRLSDKFFLRPLSLPSPRITERIELGAAPLGGSERVPRVHYVAASTFEEPSRLLDELKPLFDNPSRNSFSGPSNNPLEERPEAIWIHGPLDERAPALAQNVIFRLQNDIPQIPIIYRGFFNETTGPEILFDLAPIVQGISLIPEINDDSTAWNHLPIETICASVKNRCPLFWEIPDPHAAVSVCRRVLKDGLTTTGLVIVRDNLRRRVWETLRRLSDAGIEESVSLILRLRGDSMEQAMAAGPALLESGGEGLLVGPVTGAVDASSPRSDAVEDSNPLSTAYGILQAVRRRLTRAEFISCPSCGRTLFDLETTTERIRMRTGHLKGVKIAVMGCIVNGPGEMADADFGYVGSGAGKIDLYQNKTRVRRNLSPDEADDALVELIKENGRWVDPSE